MHLEWNTEFYGAKSIMNLVFLKIQILQIVEWNKQLIF